MYLNPGQTFVGRYRVDRFIAEGGMGAVFAGMHLTTEAPVAIKILRPAMLASAAAAKQFELEAKVAARIRSPHIVQVLDAGSDPETGLSFLVMELLDGKSLEALVNEGGPLAPEQVVRYLEQVAAGLHKAHTYRDKNGDLRPIVHRDLKPDNLFVEAPQSTNPMVKILDFGIAKVLSGTAGVSQDLRGTPLYMACEQATGRAVTPQTDIWALGLIAFYLLTGKAFWKSATGEGTLASLVGEITIEPVPPASERLHELGATQVPPSAFDVWLQRCLERDPERRFRTATDAIIQLAESLNIEPRPLDLGNSVPPVVGTPDSLKETVPIDSGSPDGSTGELSVASTHSPMATAPSLKVLWLSVAAVAVAGGAWYLVAGGSGVDAVRNEGDVAASTTQPETAHDPRAGVSPDGAGGAAPRTEQRGRYAAESATERPSIAPVVAEPDGKPSDQTTPAPKPTPKSHKPSQASPTPKPQPTPEPAKPAAPDPYGER